MRTRAGFGFGEYYLGIYYLHRTGEWILAKGRVMRPVMGRGGYVKAYNFVPNVQTPHGTFPSAGMYEVPRTRLFALDDEMTAKKELFKLKLKGEIPK